MNARYALNAANARWGSLYDALYGTDAIAEDGGATRAGSYNPMRGDESDRRRDKRLLDADRAAGDRLSCAMPRLCCATAWRLVVALEERRERRGLKDAARQFAGYRGRIAAQPYGPCCLQKQGLHLEIKFDDRHCIGKTDRPASPIW